MSSLASELAVHVLPGYFGLSAPSLFKVRQYGVMSFSPLADASVAACAATQTKIPVVMGQPIVALCLDARAARI
jgi:hypothetical protein